MEKINSFSINSLEISGFKRFAEPIGFDFGNVNFVTGSNRVGKSTIADAISFAITGTPFFGDGHLDRLYSEDNPDITVKLVLTSKTGKHELVRKRRRDKMTISFDDYTLRQQDLTEMFGEKDLFLSIFNPLYFIEKLGDEGKGLLEKHLPFIESEKVLSQLSPYNQELLKDKDIISPENYLKAIRDELREQEETLIFLEGQSSLIMTQRKETANSLNLLQLSLEDLETQIVALEQKRGNGALVPKEQLDNMITMLNECLSERPTEPNQEDIEVELEGCNAKLQELSNQAYESKYATEIIKMQAELESAYAEHKRVNTQSGAIKAGSSCPLCLNEITEQYASNIKQKLHQQLSKIVAKGSALRSQLKEIEALDKQSKQVFEDFKSEDVKKIQAKSTELKQKLESNRKLFAQELTDYEAKLSQYREAIANLQAHEKNGSLSAAEALTLESLYEKRTITQADFTAQKTVYQGQVDNTPEKIEAVNAAIKDKKALLTAVTEYSARRAELIFGCLTAGAVSFKLCEIAKTTGEIKDCFKFTYEGRDYKRLSRSEKILAGVCVSEMIRKLSNKDYPIFIDDSESIAGIPVPSGQTFLARVVAKAPLDVKVMQPARSENVAA